MIEIYPHEAWCPRCQVSHPPGTRRCLHCGGGVMPVRPVEGMRAAVPSTARGPIEIPTRPEIVDEDESERGAPPARGMTSLRLGMNALWIALFVIVTVVRVCSERG